MTLKRRKRLGLQPAAREDGFTVGAASPEAAPSAEALQLAMGYISGGKAFVHELALDIDKLLDARDRDARRAQDASHEEDRQQWEAERERIVQENIARINEVDALTQQLRDARRDERQKIAKAVCPHCRGEQERAAVLFQCRAGACRVTAPARGRIADVLAQIPEEFRPHFDYGRCVQAGIDIDMPHKR